MLRIALSFISGIALSLAFPKANLHWLAWCSLAPLMYCLYRTSWRTALLCGLLFGLGFFGSLLYWVAIFGRLPWAALTVFQALYVAAFVVPAKLIGGRSRSWGRLILLPALWVAVEWFRSLGLFGLTWGDLGYSQHKVLPIIQIASYTGVWGVSFLVAMVNALLANLAAARAQRYGCRAAWIQSAAVAAVLAIVTTSGLLSLRSRPGDEANELRVAVLQGNINQDTQDLAYFERSLNTYQSMTLDAEAEHPDLVVWPETVVPGCVGRDPYLQRWLSKLAARVGAYLLVGGCDEDDRGGTYNSAFLIGPGQGVLAHYSKVRIVPFGEYVPARKYLPFLRYYRVTPADLCRGPGYRVVEGGPYKLGVAICFESIFPDICRRLDASGAEILCVITNDAWFGRTAAAEQHTTKSVFRAVENRKYLVRAAATGISCVIDPYGRVPARADIWRKAILYADIRSSPHVSFYAEYGDWFVHVCLGAAGVLAGSALIRRRSARRQAPQSNPPSG